ncbi:MAG: type II secretion system F family protein [Candidatus Anstonellaceae archaeon]
MKEFEELFFNLPFYTLFSKKPEMEEFYKKCHFNLSFRAFSNLYLLSVFLFSFLIFIVSLILSANFSFSFGLFAIFLALLILIGYRLPKLFAKMQAKKFEQDLPAVLRAISLYLQIGMTMEKVIYTIANSNYSCSKIFQKLYDLINLGSSVPAALSKIENYVYSMQFSRVAHALLLCYEKGYTPSNLESLADDFSSLAQTEVKQQSSKLALFSLVFVVVSSVLPAFYLIIFIAAGPLFGLEQSSTESVFLFYVVILPILVLGVLFLMMLLTPSASSPIIYDKVFQQTNKLLLEKFPFFKQKYLLALALGVFGFGLASILGLSNQGFFIALFFSSIPFLIYGFYESDLLAQINEMEEQIPNMLLAGAAEKKFSLEKMLQDAQKSPSKILVKEAKEVLLQIKAGANPLDVLKKWQENTPSMLLIRSIKLILIGYVSGGNMQKSLRAAAEDILSAFNLSRERTALISLQTYTLLASASLLVPIILSVSLSFAEQLMDISQGSDIGILSAKSQQKLIENAKIAIPIYLFINSAAVAFAISNFQNSRQKFILYFIILAAVSELVYFLLPTIGL